MSTRQSQLSHDHARGRGRAQEYNRSTVHRQNHISSMCLMATKSPERAARHQTGIVDHEMHAIAQQQCYAALAAAAPLHICAFFRFFSPATQPVAQQWRHAWQSPVRGRRSSSGCLNPNTLAAMRHCSKFAMTLQKYLFVQQEITTTKSTFIV